MEMETGGGERLTPNALMVHLSEGNCTPENLQWLKRFRMEKPGFSSWIHWVFVLQAFLGVNITNWTCGSHSYLSFILQPTREKPF
jgi:hypothetical protein